MTTDDNRQVTRRALLTAGGLALAGTGATLVFKGAQPHTVTELPRIASPRVNTRPTPTGPSGLPDGTTLSPTGTLSNQAAKAARANSDSAAVKVRYGVHGRFVDGVWISDEDPAGDRLTNGGDAFSEQDASWLDGLRGDGSGDFSLSAPQMGAPSIFVPAIGGYAPLLAVNGFVPNPAHPGWETLQLPSTARKAAWYADTPLVATGSGTTVVAGHVAYRGVRGAFYHLADLVPGNTVWTCAPDGTIQRWMVTRAYSLPQTQFPAEYWRTVGPRRLVMVTCGGRFNTRTRHHEDNTFAEAVPWPAR